MYNVFIQAIAVKAVKNVCWCRLLFFHLTGRCCNGAKLQYWVASKAFPGNLILIEITSFLIEITIIVTAYCLGVKFISVN